MAPIPRLRAHFGPALLSYGFRPFFLLGACYAALAILAWLPFFYGELVLATALSPILFRVTSVTHTYPPLWGTRTTSAPQLANGASGMVQAALPTLGFSARSH